jgi:hypothetical protein
MSIFFVSERPTKINAAGWTRWRIIQNIPYKHFGRKNIGYLFAIQRGAQFLFDFDDDDILNEDPSTVDGSCLECDSSRECTSDDD